MPIAVQFDQPVGGRIPRALVYGGAVNVTSPSPTSVAFAMFARELIGDAFGGRNPELARFDLLPADHAAILRSLTRRFTQHPESSRFVQALVTERGGDPETTYVGVPRLRACTGDEHLVAGLDAWRPRRDTWCAAPLAQLNHWMPVYEIAEGDGIALHLEYFSQAIANDSAGYDHAVGTSAPLPGPTETVNPFSASTFVTPVGGMLQFSGQHLYCSVPNDSDRTRFSIDFATVDVDDIRAGLGARNVDCRCTGSSIRDFVRAADLAPMPEDVVAMLDDRPETGGEPVYAPPTEPVFTPTLTEA